MEEYLKISNKFDRGHVRESKLWVHFVCLFVCADGKEKQIKAAVLAMQVSYSWDLAARPRTFYCSSTLILRG